MNKPFHIPATPYLILAIVLLAGSGAAAAQNVQTITRSKVWYGHGEMGLEADGIPRLSLAYPGYYDAPNAASITSVRTGTWWMYNKSGGPFGDRLIGGEFSNEITVLEPNTLIKNYNFEKSLNEPEEYTLSVARTKSDFPSAGRRELRYEVKVMGWSLPAYDDFILIKYTITNIGSEALTDFHTGWGRHIRVSEDGWSMNFRSDDEYEWHADLTTRTSENGAFVFFDDTSIPVATPNSPVQYGFSPGDVTGDRGDPGNIREANSIDRALHSPQIFVDRIIDVTPNRNGEKKVFQNILSTDQRAPKGEFYPDVGATGSSYELLAPVFIKDQPRKSWRELNADASTSEGSVYEREAQYTQTIGPYTLAPGATIEVLRVLIFGEMDRNITMLGGLKATQNFKKAGIDSLKTNWTNMLRLVDNGFRPTAYPPPTVGNPPQVSLGNELDVNIFADEEAGTQGHVISWQPIPDSYRDPIKGTNDHVGYRVYRSEQSVTGPWALIADLTKAQAQALVQNGRITYRVEGKPGVPMRFAVTSYDDSGLESGRTAYNLFALAAKPVASNDFAKVRVVPNPFRQTSGLPDLGEAKRLSFINIPGKCTIRIYTVAGDLVQTVEHDDGFGEESWGSSEEDNYMLTRFAQNVMPGVYVYHVESHVPGHEGESATGRFAIVK